VPGETRCDPIADAVAGLAHIPAGPGLAAALASVDLKGLTGSQCVDVVKARYRQASHERGQLFAVIAEVMHRDEADSPVFAQWPGEFAADEVRAALVLTRRSAEPMTDWLIFRGDAHPHDRIDSLPPPPNCLTLYVGSASSAGTGRNPMRAATSSCAAVVDIDSTEVESGRVLRVPSDDTRIHIRRPETDHGGHPTGEGGQPRRRDRGRAAGRADVCQPAYQVDPPAARRTFTRQRPGSST